MVTRAFWANRRPVLIYFLLLAGCADSLAQQTTRPVETSSLEDNNQIPTPQQWQLLRRSTDRALTWLAAQQQTDGSFRSDDRGQPAITSLAVLAFLSCGYQPGSGPH